tara:strand:+ start:51 stop:260 length:210 start_codon:yes stop_codon:yes gene_type:complete
MSKPVSAICKILKINSKKLIKLRRNTCEQWDSLAHLEIMFIIEKYSKKKISNKKLINLNKGIDVINSFE